MTRPVFGRLAAFGGTFALAVAGLAGFTAAPASAATAPPWHWTQVTGSVSLTWFSTQSVSLACPAGYTPMSGGFSAADGELRLKGEHADYGTQSFVFVVYNPTGSTHGASLDAWCALASEVGAVESVSTTFNRTISGRSGSSVNCPANKYVVGGDADWSSTGTRYIDFAGPGQLGSSWAVSASSTVTGDMLTITARCAPVGGIVTAVTNVQTVSGATTVTTGCPLGKRILSGGSFVRVSGQLAIDAGTDHGYAPISTSTRTTWTSTTSSTASGDFAVTAVCIDTNVPVIQWTAGPGQYSSSASGQLTFNASDPVGQSVTVSCTMDSTPVTCQSGVATAYGSLAEGPHTFYVMATNEDGEHTWSYYHWNIDLTAPTVTTKSATSDVDPTADIRVGFSETVTGVDTSSFKLIDDATAEPVPGTATQISVLISGTLVVRSVFTPSSPLLAHHDYTVQLTGGIHDQAGNALAAVSWPIRTANATPTCTDVSAGTTDVNIAKPVNLDCADGDGDALTFAVVTPPNHGDVSAPSGAGAATYTPDPGYVGVDSFTYQADDGFGGTSSTATVTLSVGPDHLPTCQDVAKPVPFDSAVTVALDCSDVDAGQTLGYVFDTAPSHGGLGTLSGDGQVVYTPFAGYTGQDTFTYHATDGYGGASSVRTVTLYVATDAPPTCAAATVQVKHATAVTVPLSCTDPDTGQTLTLAIAGPPAHGALSAMSAGSVTYTPSAGFGGTDSFTYTASDGHGGTSSPATVTLKVAPGATALSLKAKVLTITGGSKDRLSGRLRDVVTGRYLNGKTVLLQSRRSTTQSWSTIASTTTQTVSGAVGTAVFTVKPARSRYYRVVYRGGSAYLPSTSTAVRIKVVMS